MAVIDMVVLRWWWFVFFFQAEDGIRDAQESRGLGDVYKRQHPPFLLAELLASKTS